MAFGYYPLPRRQKVFFLSPDVTTVVISVNLCALITAAFVMSSEQFHHWFILPIFLCGVLISFDAVNWFRGKTSLLDPAGVLGVLGFHFFFLAPLLHVHWDWWMRYTIGLPADWRPWLGGMAFINLAGIILYQSSRQVSLAERKGRVTAQTSWRIDQRRFIPLLAMALFVTAAMQAWVYYQAGGLSGYINAYEDQGFTGMGWLFILSESFPKLAFLGFAVLSARTATARSWITLCIVLLLYLVLQLLFGGLRGSRSNTLWALLWAVGVIHLWIRPIPRSLLLPGFLFLLGFMYLYGFYKGAGSEAFRIFEQPSAIAELEAETGRTMEAVLLGDIARSDVQAFLLYRIATPAGDYELSWGRTYLGALALLIPRAIWPDRPPTKVKEGTQVQRGMDAYVPGEWTSSRIYGLAGETMLNFGPMAVPLAFILLGFVVKIIRRYLLHWKYPDSRVLLIPFFINICILMLGSDSDNILWFIFKNLSIPLIVVVLSSRVMPSSSSQTVVS